jgi:hypothetical protein
MNMTPNEGERKKPCQYEMAGMMELASHRRSPIGATDESKLEQGKVVSGRRKRSATSDIVMSSTTLKLIESSKLIKQGAEAVRICQC